MTPTSAEPHDSHQHLPPEPDSVPLAIRRIVPDSPQQDSGLLWVAQDGRRSKPRGRRGNYTRTQVRSHVSRVAHEKKRLQEIPANDAAKRDNAKDGDLKDRQVVRKSISSQTPVWDVSEHWIDPFDSLPVRRSPVVNELLKYFFETSPGRLPFSDEKLLVDSATPTEQRQALKWENTAWGLYRSEETSLLMILSETALVRDMMQDSTVPPSRAFFNLRAKTLQAVRENLPELEEDGTKGKTKKHKPITDSYVATISGLGATASFSGDLESSLAHRKAMLTLVAAKGGLDTFGPFAKRLLRWTEFYVCTANFLAPALPPVPFKKLQHRLALPSDFKKIAQAFHLQTLSYLPHVEPDSAISTLLLELHVLTLAKLPHWEAVINREALSAVADDAEYRVLVELAHLKDECPRRCEEQNAPDLVHAVTVQGCQTYLWGALSDMPIETVMNGLFLARLKEAFSDIQGELIATWIQVSSIQALLRILFAAWFVSMKITMWRGDETSAWYEERLFDTLRMFKADEVSKTFEVWDDIDRFEFPRRLMWNRFADCEARRVAAT